MSTGATLSSVRDLFGQLIPAASAISRKKRWKKTGHAAPIGSGPNGETCRTCFHRIRTESGSGKGFQKCGLTRGFWSHGPGTDIKCRDAACARWQQRATK